MPELHSRQPRFTYSACGLFTKHYEKIKKCKETSDLKCIYKNELDKAYSAHDAAYSISKDLAKKTVSGTILKDRPYEIALNPKYDGYQRGLASMEYKFCNKKVGSGTTREVKANVNEVLAQKFYKPVINNFKRRKVYVRFKDNI